MTNPTDQRLYMEVGLRVYCCVHREQLMVMNPLKPVEEDLNQLKLLVSPCTQCVDAAVRLALEVRQDNG